MPEEKTIDWRRLKKFYELPPEFRERFMSRVDAFDHGWLRDNVRVILVLRPYGKTQNQEVEIFANRVIKTWTGFEILARVTAIQQCELYHCVFLVLMETPDGIEEVLMDARRRNQKLSKNQTVQISFSKAFK